jgi:hypothetical protein
MLGSAKLTKTRRGGRRLDESANGGVGGGAGVEEGGWGRVAGEGEGRGGRDIYFFRKQISTFNFFPLILLSFRLIPFSLYF